MVGLPVVYFVPEDSVMSIVEPSEKVPQTLTGILSPSVLKCNGSAVQPDLRDRDTRLHIKV
jgi:hypothetical protein